MIRVQIKNANRIIGYDLFPKRKITIKNFDYSFLEGKCYCLSYKDYSGYLISMILGGFIKEKQVSIFSEKNEKIKDLEKQSILIGIEDETFFHKINYLKLFEEKIKTVEKRIQLYEKYGLSENRLNRKLKYMSSERWRVSFALGELYSKKIYCFPWISSELIDMYSSTWLFEFIKEVKENGGIILIPTEVTEKNKILFDEVLV